MLLRYTLEINVTQISDWELERGTRKAKRMMAKRLKGTREVLVDQPGEITLVANNHIADIAKLYKNYEISFDIFPTGTFAEWDNILHITNGMIANYESGQY